MSKEVAMDQGMKTIDIEALEKALWEAVEFHRNNANDPYGISNAVMCALTEVSMAISKAKKDSAIDRDKG